MRTWTPRIHLTSGASFVVETHMDFDEFPAWIKQAQKEGHGFLEMTPGHVDPNHIIAITYDNN